MNKTATLTLACTLLCTAVFAQQKVLMLHINEGKPGSAFCLECESLIEPECELVEDIEIREGRYECKAGKTVRKKVTLKKPRIELEKVIQNIDEYIPENLRKREVLENKMNSNFLKDFNKMPLVTRHTNHRFCYNVNIYDNKTLIATFETNGNKFYDRKNKLMYELYKKDSIYNPAENFLRKYWGIFEESRCR